MMSTKKKISTCSTSSRAANEGVTQLMYACQQADPHQVKMILLRKFSSVRDRDRTGKTALHYCAENSSSECAELLLNTEPSLINAADDEGYTPLHLAVIAGQRVIIRYLVSRGADVNHLDSELHSVIHWATVCGELDALDTVLDAGADPCTPDVHGAYPIHYAAQMCGQRKGASNSLIPQRDGRVGLGVLKKLLSRRVPVDVVDRDARQPLLWAASSGSADAILALVNAGADVNAADKDGLTALHCAASRGHSDCLETLVALCGTDVDLVDSNGCTALFYAVTLGHADCAQLLLNYGANPNHQDNKGRTPSYCGASKGQMESLRLLVQHGADLWIRNTKGDVALHEAIGSGRKDLTMWLLKLKSSAANLPNNDGRCPLHVAAINNNIEMCKILIDHEVEINSIMRSSRGQLLTPLDAALRKGNRTCAKFLQLHGALPAAKLTDSKALQRALSQALTDSQRGSIHQLAVSHHDDYPSMTDSQLSTMSSVLHAPQFKPILRSFSRLEDSSTQTQVEESFYGECKDAQIQLTSADLRHCETESSLRRRRTRRRANRRSLTEAPRPPPNDEELRWKSRQRNSYHNDSDLVYSGTDDENEQSYGRRFRQYQSDYAPSIRGYVVSYDSSDVNAEAEKTEAAVIEIVQVDANGCDRPPQSILSTVGTESSGQKDSGFSDVIGTERTPRISVGDPGGTSVDEEEGEEDGDDPAGGNMHRRTNGHCDPSVDEANNGEPVTTDNCPATLTNRSMEGQKEIDKPLHRATIRGQERSIDEHIECNGEDGTQSPPEKDAPSPTWETSGHSQVQKATYNAPYPSLSEAKSRSKLILEKGSNGLTSTQSNPPTSRRTRDDEELPALILKSSARSITLERDQSNRDITMAPTTALGNSTPRTLAFNRSFRKPSRHHADDVAMLKKPPFHLRRSKSERMGRQSESIDDEGHFKSDPFASMSLTRATQMRIRRYQLERKIFQQLLDLKQMQIRSGQSNEQVFAKRLIESFRKDSVTVGLRPYDGGYSFLELENYLYGQLRLVQGGSYLGCLPLVDGDEENQKSNEFQCTLPTSRCPHAMYAYTGIPCAAYIPYHRHHPLPKQSEPDRTVLPKLNTSDGNIMAANTNE